MTRSEITRRVKALLVRELRCSAGRITEDADLGEKLGACSLDKITVTCGIENEFGIKLSDDECAFARTFGTLVDLVEVKLENRRCTSRPERLMREADDRDLKRLRGAGL